MDLDEQLRLVRIFLNVGHIADALTLLEGLLAFLTPDESPIYVDCLNELSQCAWRSGNIEEAEGWACEAIFATIHCSPYIKGRADALSNLGVAWLYRSAFSFAELLFRDSLTLQKDIGDLYGTTTSLNNLGMLLGRIGRRKEAFDYLEQCLALKKEIGDQRGTTIVLGNIGSVHSNNREYTQAESYYKRALAIQEALGDRFSIAFCLMRLGSIKRVTGDLDMALEYLQRSLPFWEEIDNQLMIFSIAWQLGDLFVRRGELFTAERYLQRCLDLWDQIPTLSPLGYASCTLGELYLAKGEFSKAEIAFRKSLAYFEKTHLERQVAEMQYYLVKLKVLQGDLKEASDLVARLAPLAHQSELLEIEARYHLSAAHVCFARADLFQAQEQAAKAVISAKQVPNIELVMESLELLVRIHLNMYRVTRQSESIYAAERVLRETEELAEREKLHGLVIEVLIVQALLKKARLDFAEAYNHLIDAKTLAEAQDLEIAAQKAQHELSLLEEQLHSLEQLQHSSRDVYDETQLKRVLQYFEDVHEFAPAFRRLIRE